MLSLLVQRFTTIGHAHPKGDWPRRMERQYSRTDIPFVEDFDDVCRQADVYVCDNSSTIPEFASTGRPVVLLNARHWHRQGGVGGRFWDWAHIGVNVDRPEHLIAGIEEALADAPERQAAREDALGIVYGVRSGGAELAADAIMSWLRSRQAVAA
jgi:UDP-N-acetylglucosamine:LPS N-acetylglucosamine transferase